MIIGGLYLLQPKSVTSHALLNIATERSQVAFNAGQHDSTECWHFDKVLNVNE